jgi:hypothetical protein
VGEAYIEMGSNSARSAIPPLTPTRKTAPGHASLIEARDVRAIKRLATPAATLIATPKAIATGHPAPPMMLGARKISPLPLFREPPDQSRGCSSPHGSTRFFHP